MRICHVIESAATGSASVMLTLADLGARDGHDVTVVYSPTRANAEFRERGATIAGVHFIPMKMAHAPQPHDLFAAAQLRALLSRLRFDVVHSHSSKAGALARLAGIGRGSVQIYAPHGFVTMGRDPGKIFSRAERALSRLCHAVVAVSELERQHGISLGIADERIAVIPNGIDASLIDPVPRDRPDRKNVTIGFVGRLSDQKNPLLAIEAFRTLLDGHPSAMLMMIGDGKLKGQVAARIDQLGLASRVVLAGEQAALRSYPDFEALLCSSRYEGMPLTFLEALAHGVPIISTDVGGADELIDHGETGYVCDPSPEALGAALARVVTLGDAERLAMRRRSLAKARQFTTHTMYHQTIALYEHCLRRA